MSSGNGKQDKGIKNKRLKRANGQGGVSKLPGRRRNPWRARITIDWEETADGKMKQKFQVIGYFPTRKDAEKALALHSVSPVSPKADITLGELYKEWSESRYTRISKSTKYNYKASWNYLSVYEKEKFTELRTAHLQKIIDDNMDKSRSLLEKIKAMASMLYKYAIQNDITNKNYAEYVELPKADSDKGEIFSDLEIQTIADNAGTEWVDTILILIYTGMRISEMLNLTKFNVDLKTGIIIGGVKTEAGKNRPIPIHDKIMPYIKKWYAKNGDRLICDSEGKRILPEYYRKRIYYPTLKKLVIRPLKPHRCRHTWASLMKRAGVDEFYITQIIGHTNSKLTEEVYTHAYIEELKKAINMI